MKQFKDKFTIIEWEYEDQWSIIFTGKDKKGNYCYIEIPKVKTSWQYSISY